MIVLSRDFIQSGCNIKLTEERATLLTKILAVTFGIVSYGVVFLVKYLPGVLEAALGIFGIMGGPVLGAFVLGMFFPFANELVRKWTHFLNGFYSFWVNSSVRLCRKGLPALVNLSVNLQLYLHVKKKVHLKLHVNLQMIFTFM